MSKILSFHKPFINIPKGYPRQQLFLVGKIYVGPDHNRTVTYYYLRRNLRRGEITNKVTTWSLKIFGNKEGTDQETFIEIDTCTENEVIEMLEKWNLFHQVTYKKLYGMGWKGQIKKDARVVYLKSSKKWWRA